MNISKINIGVTGQDLMSMYNDFVEIKELSLEKIEIKDEIIIVGKFTKGVVINFECRVKLSSMQDGLILGMVTGFKILNIGIASFLRKVALKYALKSLSDKGISYDKGKVIVQYKYLLKDITYVDFDINDINCSHEALQLELKNLQISLGGELKKEVELLSFNKKEEADVNEEIKKASDGYTSGRAIVENKLPEKAKKYSDYIFVLPDIVALIYRLLKDKRVSMKTKVVISAAVAYIAVPSDIIPDKVPFVGKIDDIAIGIFALNVIMTDVPLNIVLENWQGKNDIILVVKNLIEYATNFTGAKNIDSLYRVVEEVLSV